MISLFDKMAQIGMALGLVLIFQPYWHGGLKWGFFVTLASTLLHIITSHMIVPNALKP